MEKMRTTTHRGRGSKRDGKAYNVRHNDRNFQSENDDHIDRTLTTKNAYLCVYKGMTFEDAEKRFYAEHFAEALEAQNEKHRARRQYDRCRTTDDVRTGLKTCPEEIIYEIGNAGNCADKNTLIRIWNEYQKWHKKAFPQVQLLDVAVHVDEPNAGIHLHQRQVYIGHNEAGQEVVSQAKALEEMGVERPDPTKKQGQYNNPKMTYTKMCRDKWVDICRQHGIEIETEPKDASMTGLSLLEYKNQQEAAKLANITADIQQHATALNSLYDTLEDISETDMAQMMVAEKLKKADPALYNRLWMDSLREIGVVKEMKTQQVSKEKESIDRE